MSEHDECPARRELIWTSGERSVVYADFLELSVAEASINLRFGFITVSNKTKVEVREGPTVVLPHHLAKTLVEMIVDRAL